MASAFAPDKVRLRSEISADLDFGKKFYPTYTRVENVTAVRLLSLVRKLETTFDLDALNVFLRIGTFVGTDTPFRHVRADPPGYEWATTVRPTELSRSQVIDSYIDLFQTAIARCQDEDISLPISGGQDSRHILLELCRQGRKPQHCWTVDFPWNPSEAEIAGRLCAALQIPHQTFIPKGDIFGAEARKDALTDYSSTQHFWLAEAVAAGLVRGHGMFDGIGGDVLSAGLFLTEHRVQMLTNGHLDELVEDIVGHEEKIFGVDDQNLFPRWRAVEKVNEEFRKHLAAPDPISSFYFWNRTRRDIGCSPFALFRHSAKKVHTPYLDTELCRFLASLSPDLTVSKKLHSETITRAYPDFAHLPYANRVLDLKRSTALLRRIAVQAFGYVLMNNVPFTSKPRVLLRLALATMFSSRAKEAFSLVPQLVYLGELFAEADR